MTTREVRDDQHGTITGYVYGCRCHRCTAASREYARKYRAENRAATNEISRLSGQKRRQEKREARYAEEASRDEVKQWARGLGFTVNGSLTGRHADALIDRYNREHPERPYLRPNERSTAS